MAWHLHSAGYHISLQFIILRNAWQTAVPSSHVGPHCSQQQREKRGQSFSSCEQNLKTVHITSAQDPFIGQTLAAWPKLALKIDRWEVCPAQTGWFHSWSKKKYGKITLCHRKPWLGYVQGRDIIDLSFQSPCWYGVGRALQRVGSIVKARGSEVMVAWLPVGQLT